MMHTLEISINCRINVSLYSSPQHHNVLYEPKKYIDVIYLCDVNNKQVPLHVYKWGQWFNDETHV